jgi:23S rRNA (adenine2503-C2)-methyltransferase
VSSNLQKLIPLSGLLPEEIHALIQNEPFYRAKQIFKWISEGASSFNQMTNLSASLRETLSADYTIRNSRIEQKLIDPDGTIKLQLALNDNFCVETVLLIDSEKRKTACVSCQVGCAMGCAFCKTGTLGLARNLTPNEIVDQFLFLEQEAGKLDNIVFMGMGEPMHNLESIRKCIGILTHNEGRKLSSRRITISTAGIINGIYDLANNGPPVRLAVSLTTADPVLREKLMPVTKGNPLHDLKNAIGYFIEKTGKRCTLEAALLGGVNTDNSQAELLASFAKGLDTHVNVIPWNPVNDLPFTEPSRNECYRFIQKLEELGINVTMRMKRGEKIGGACGQLGKIVVDKK